MSKTVVEVQLTIGRTEAELEAEVHFVAVDDNGVCLTAVFVGEIDILPALDKEIRESIAEDVSTYRRFDTE